MTTRLLVKQNSKPLGENYRGNDLHNVGKSQLEEITVQCTPPSISNPAGNVSRVELTWSNSDKYIIDDLILQWTATNSDATNAPTWLNNFLTIDSIKLLLNKTEILYIMDRYQLMSILSLYLRQYGSHEILQQLQKCRQATSGYAGDSVAVSGTQYFYLPLTWLWPCLQGFIINDGVKFIDIEITFATNYGSVLNGQFVVSNTTDNAYGSNLTYSNIAIKQVLSRHYDARLYKHINPIVLLLDKFDTKIYNRSWATAQTDNFSISLSNEFPKRSRILGLMVYAQSTALITAYNDADAALYYSGAGYIGFKVKSNSRTIIDLSSTTQDLQQRRRYDLDFNRKRFSAELPQEIIAGSSNLGKIYIPQTYIDLSNIDVENSCHQVPISGISNYDKDIDVELFCTGSINSSTNIYCMLHYIELVTVDGKGNVQISR